MIASTSGVVAGIARITLVEALRNRLLWLVLAFAVIGLGLAGFLGALAITEHNEIQTVALAALLRLAAVFVAATFVAASMVREFADKGVALVLSLPISRLAYLLGKFVGFAGVGVVVALPFVAVLAVMSPSWGTLLWGASLILEVWLVVGFALLCVITFNQVVAALAAVAGFYFLARSIATLLLVAGSPLVAGTWVDSFIRWVLRSIELILPRLDAFTRSDWLVHQLPSMLDFLWLAGQTGLYVALLLAAAAVDLYRRNF